MKQKYFRASLLFIILCLSGISILGQGVPAPRTIRLQPFLSGLNSPLYLTHAKDGSRRIFVVQQRGIIKVVQPGSNTTADFLNITSKVSQVGSETGLLGLAFHPQFSTNSYFFVNYTRQSDGATIIARYKAINNNSVADPNSERIVLTVPQPFANHNGGMIEFRNDGGVNNLYIGMGDGGSANDPQNNAQNINSLLGKYLRITPDVSGNDANPPYTVPADNPYVGTAGEDEIYAIGMRNPWRWSFDRANPSQLWAGDVGQDGIEEIELITRGGNYGWRVYEGTRCTQNDPALCIPSNFTMPITEYSHFGGRCAITGGYVYRGGLRTLPDGAYIFGDYCSGEYWMWYNNQQYFIQDTPRLISSFGEDEDGELYVVGLGGTVEKITRAKSSADFDGDLKTDISVFRPSNGYWYIQNSSNNTYRSQLFGVSEDIPVPEDYDGDNITDIAVFRPSNGTWYIQRSSDNSFTGIAFGQQGDIPVASDYDGDAKADIAVFRPSNGTWYFLRSRTGNSFTGIAFGQQGDIPLTGDYDGDGKTDITVFRPSNGAWYRLNSSNGAFSGIGFGFGTDIPVVGDFDGDGKSDITVYRPSNGVWYRFNSSNGAFVAIAFGAAEDIPVPGDYDGDGKDDIAVFRPSTGSWYILRSSDNGFYGIAFGQNGDLPLPRYDAP